MDAVKRQAGKTPSPGLVILTGASHTGKTSVGQELLRLSAPPAALLAVDDVLSHVLLKAPGDRWSQIPLAYDLIEAQSAVLLERGWLVVVESTFTYVPVSGDPEFHHSALAQLTAIAERQAAPWLLVQLRAGIEDLESRAAATGRLDPAIVRSIAALHEVASLPDSTLQLDSATEQPAELASTIAARLRAGR